MISSAATGIVTNAGGGVMISSELGSEMFVLAIAVLKINPPAKTETIIIVTRLFFIKHLLNSIQVNNGNYTGYYNSPIKALTSDRLPVFD